MAKLTKSLSLDEGLDRLRDDKFAKMEELQKELSVLKTDKVTLQKKVAELEGENTWLHHNVVTVGRANPPQLVQASRILELENLLGKAQMEIRKQVNRVNFLINELKESNKILKAKDKETEELRNMLDAVKAIKNEDIPSELAEEASAMLMDTNEGFNEEHGAAAELGESSKTGGAAKRTRKSLNKKE